MEEEIKFVGDSYESNDVVYEKKLCTPQHSINGYVPKPTDHHLSGKTCDCGKLIWTVINTCGCQIPKYELVPRPNQ